MKLEIKKVDIKDIEPMRAMFLNENQFQIRYDSVHQRGWADEYLLIVDGQKVGYASVKGSNEIHDRDSIFEWFLLPESRFQSETIFQTLIEETGVTHVVAQSNEPSLSELQAKYSFNLRVEALLFGNPSEKNLPAPNSCRFRKIDSQDHPLFEHHGEPEGPFGIERTGEIVATGGFFQHYNFPFVDLYMEVREDCRGQGIGSYLLQELIRHCHSIERIPAARCSPTNLPSKKTLLRGGFTKLGSIQVGDLKMVPGRN